MRNHFRLPFRPHSAATAAALLGAAVLAPPAAAALTITSPLAADFAGVTLNGAAQTTTATLDAFTVTDDAPVVGSGWHVTVQATQFKEYSAGAYVAGGKTLPAGSLTMPAPTVTPVGTSSPGPTIQAGAPWAIDGAGTVKIASAAVNEGLGRYDFSGVTLSLAVPPNAYAVTYRSAITVSAVTGP